MSLQIMHNNGHKIAYETFGDPSKPPLLLVHGYISGRHVWRNTIPHLLDRYYAIAIDLLGHSDSDKPEGADYSIQAQAKRVLALADSLNIEHFTLVGHSMGGQISLTIASLVAPQRVIRLVNVAGVASARLTRFQEVVAGNIVPWVKRVPLLLSLPRTSIKNPWGARLYLGSWFYKFNAIPFADWAIDRQKCYQVGMENSIYPSWQAIYGFNVSQHLRKVTVPTLTIFGKNDNVVPVTDATVAHQGIPNSQLVMLDDCGHFPMYEKNAEYLQALKAFLDT